MIDTGKDKINQKRKGFTLIEFIIVVGLIAIIAILIYPPYRSSFRSFNLSTTKTSLQQNARIAMKRMVKELSAGMIVDARNEPDDDQADWIPNNGDAGDDESTGAEKEDRYNEKASYFIILYLPDEDPKSRGNEVALYAALPNDAVTTDDESKQPIDPANYTLPAGYSLSDAPWIYLRRHNNSTSSWENPEPLIHQEEDSKVTQLCFILGGDNQDRVLITLKLAQKGPTLERWRTYKLISTAKLGAR